MNKLQQLNESTRSRERESNKNGHSKSNSLVGNYLKLFREFRRNDLVGFCEKHDELYREAKATGDHIPVTRHYYGLMASLIATYYGDGWHFCPPQHKGQCRADANLDLYRRLACILELEPGKTSLDVGCGVGGMMRMIARETGANLTGITLGENEVDEGNRLAQQDDIQDICRLVQGDSQAMPFDDQTFDAAYAVYALKYYPTLDRVLSEIHRVLKAGGRFVAYCLCKSNSYLDSNPQHKQVLSQFEYSTAMPSLHSVQSMIAAAEKVGFECSASVDISRRDLTWYSYWVQNPIMPWVVSSRLIYGLTRGAEAIRILPRGFTRFNDTFLAGTLRHIIRGGRMGILTGSALMTFEKK